MFTESFWRLLRKEGRIGIVLPTGIYADFGTTNLREELLERGRLDFLYAFQNEKRVFAAAHHAAKQVAVVATRGGPTTVFRTRFRMGVGDSPEAHEIPDDFLRNDPKAMVFTPADIRANSPKTLSFLELKSQRDLDTFRKIYAHSFRIGDEHSGWEVSYACEFHMTNDSTILPPREELEAKHFRRDVFGNWLDPEGGAALPLYEGRMVGHFDCFQKGWVSGKGRTAVWRELPSDAKAFEPQFLVNQHVFCELMAGRQQWKVAGMSISAATNTRTVVATVVGHFPCNNALFTLRLTDHNHSGCFVLASVMNSLVFDYTARPRMSGLNLSWFILEDCPLPHRLLKKQAATLNCLVRHCAFLVLIHRRFAPDWLRLKSTYSDLVRQQWKHWWAVTESDRLRLRVEIDALCADLYGLDPEDFDWIVRDDPADPKGFYRVDRQLPFRERLTGLAAVAFRALKDGKWSAESAAGLSNDQFFEILGIPELTNPKAAAAKGLSGPLIEKRDGCHVWKPENFPADDPRHGWTWDHCWQDAVALLGSEDAVRSYIEDQPEKHTTAEPEHTGPKDLFGDPLPVKPKQKKLF